MMIPVGAKGFDDSVSRNPVFMAIGNYLPTPRSIPALRWWIAAALFASTIINYVDRQTLSLLAPYLKVEYHWSNTDYAYLVIAFRFAYSIGQTVLEIDESEAAESASAVYVPAYGDAASFHGMPQPSSRAQAVTFIFEKSTRRFQPLTAKPARSPKSAC